MVVGSPAPSPWAIYETVSPLAPLFQNTTSVQQAIAQNTLGVGYAGAGFLLFYYIGISKVLQQLGVIKPGVTKTAASSAGVISAATDYGFVSHEDFVRLGKDFAAKCRANHNCAGSLGQEIRSMSEKMTPADAHKKISGVGYISLSSPNLAGFPVGDFVVNYTSREDVLDAVYAGVYVPLWSGPTVTTKFRGVKKFDGAFRTPLPCPLGNTTYCVKISVLPLDWKFQDVMDEMAKPAAWPAMIDWVRTTVGKDPLPFFAKSIGSQFLHPGQLLNQVAGGWYAFFTHQPKSGVDIYPGKYHKLPYNLVQWMLMILAPPTPDHIDTMVEMGRKDAIAWAQENGLIPPGTSLPDTFGIDPSKVRDYPPVDPSAASADIKLEHPLLKRLGGSSTTATSSSSSGSGSQSKAAVSEAAKAKAHTTPRRIVVDVKPERIVVTPSALAASTEKGTFKASRS